MPQQCSALSLPPPSSSILAYGVGLSVTTGKQLRRLLIVILVGSGFQQAPSAFWVFAFIAAVPGAQLAQVPVQGGETEAPRKRFTMCQGYLAIEEGQACLVCL